MALLKEHFHLHEALVHQFLSLAVALHKCGVYPFCDARKFCHADHCEEVYNHENEVKRHDVRISALYIVFRLFF
jgi:hypothetical protein